jgi:hypothetical protein
MNPEETLARMRAAARQINDLDVPEESRRDAARELAALFGDLDVWVQNGGFLPASWRRPEPRKR